MMFFGGNGSSIMADEYPRLSDAERARLKAKGRALYRKACGERGESTCVDHFVRHQLARGAIDVAEDLRSFLDEQAEALRLADPLGKLSFTSKLASRVRRSLTAANQNATATPEEPGEKH
jgi:hypothetical protein